MDKNKVRKLIKKAIDSIITEKAPVDAIDALLKANEELSKSDWVSVKDNLPEYGKNVVARTKRGYINVSYRRKIPRDKISREIMDDNGFILNFNLHNEEIAYWHKIDKLEV